MSDNNGNGYAARDVATQMKLMAWFTEHKKELLNYGVRKDVCAAVYADTGLKISTYTCAQYEKALGVKRVTGGVRGPRKGSRKSAEVLARALYAVMQELHNVMQEAAIVDNVIPYDQWEQHMKAVKQVAQRRGIQSLNTDSMPSATSSQTVNA